MSQSTRGCFDHSPAARSQEAKRALTPLLLRSVFSYYPMKIGDFVSIGAGSIVEAASIGNGVEIGKNCIVVRPRLRASSLRRPRLTLQMEYRDLSSSSKTTPG